MHCKINIILNNFYSSQIDNYKKGTVVFPFNNLDEGEHKLTLKVWDVFNNSSEKEIFFNVVDSEVFIISDFNCFPNPLTTSTDFYFEYNQSENQFPIRQTQWLQPFLLVYF